MRRHDFRWLVVFAGNAFFLFVVAQINHYLSDLPGLASHGPVHLFLLGLPVAFGALRLNLGQGLAAAVATGLFAEAGLPVAPGVLMLTAAACHCTTIAVRSNFNRLEPTSELVAAIGANLVLVAVVTVADLPAGGAAAAVRVAVDLIVSQLVVVAVCRWFFAWQLALLRLFGFNLETELREPL